MLPSPAEQKKASGEEYEDVKPVTWPLNVNIEDWKVKFSDTTL